MTATATLHPRIEEVLEALDTLGHATRVRILLELAATDGGRRSPVEFARLTGRPLGVVAYHVRVLLAAKLVRRAGERRVRGAVEHYYRLTDHGGRVVAALERLAEARA